MYKDNVRTSASVKGPISATKTNIYAPNTSTGVSQAPSTGSGGAGRVAVTSSNLRDRGYPSSYDPYPVALHPDTGGYYTAYEEMKKGLGVSPSGAVSTNTNKTTPTNQTNKTSGSGSASGSNANSYASLLSAYVNRAQSLAADQLAAQRAAAQNAYNNSMNALNDAYNSQIGSLRSNYDSTVGQLNASYDNSANKVNANAEEALRQAYINRMLSQKNLGQQMSALGLNGGATETTLANMYNNYGNARNNIETTKANNLSDLAFTRDNNLAEALRNYNSAVASANNTRMGQIMNLENALANNQISAIGDYYGMLANENENYNSILKSLIGNMGKWNMTPAEVTNLVNTINTTQASPDGSSNPYLNAVNLMFGNTASNGNNVANNEANTMANAALLAQYV